MSMSMSSTVSIPTTSAPTPSLSVSMSVSNYSQCESAQGKICLPTVLPQGNKRYSRYSRYFNFSYTKELKNNPLYSRIEYLYGSSLAQVHGVTKKIFSMFGNLF